MPTTFDVIKNRVWTSYGAVTFGSRSVPSTPLNRILPGYYPCIGATFRAVVVDSAPVPLPNYYYWDEAKGAVTYMNPVGGANPTRQRNTMRFEVANPTTLVKPLPSDPLKDELAPQVLMDDDFVSGFSKLIFTEVSPDCVVSNPMILTEINYRDKDGKLLDTKPEIHSIVFVMTHAVKDGQTAMLQRVMWDGEYRAMYGCCQ